MAMKVNLIIGRAMDVTDEDLHRAVGCCGCGSLLNALGIRDAVGGGQEADTVINQVNQVEVELVEKNEETEREKEQELEEKD